MLLLGRFLIPCLAVANALYFRDSCDTFTFRSAHARAPMLRTTTTNTNINDHDNYRYRLHDASSDGNVGSAALPAIDPALWIATRERPAGAIESVFARVGPPKMSEGVDFNAGSTNTGGKGMSEAFLKHLQATAEPVAPTARTSVSAPSATAHHRTKST